MEETTQIKTKICSLCKLEKSYDDFYETRNSRCKRCTLDQNKEYRNSEEGKIKLKTYKQQYYKENKEKIKEEKHQYYEDNIEKFLLKRAKKRAKDKNLEFNLDESDIVVPDICPLLGIRLCISKKKLNNFSPSIDRINNNFGYIKGNVWIISHKANTWKSDMSIIEFIRFLGKMLETIRCQIPVNIINNLISILETKK